jgi:hypothetical protein
VVAKFEQASIVTHGAITLQLILNTAINRIDKFHRSPSELRRYRQYIYQLEQNYGSVMDFIINHRLEWQSLTPSGPPFSSPDDMKVLYNDWPYGIDPRIVHLVVWVKFDIEDDSTTGYLTPEANDQIQDYVDKMFASQMDPDHVCRSFADYQLIISNFYLGCMVQELEELKKRACRRAFPRHVV